MIPELSIIIPTATKLDLLKMCIESINRCTLTSYEVIIVANSSDKQFHAEIDKLTDNKVRALHIDKQAGFIVPCNMGAEHARGRYISVLNDDTMVGVKWARYMLRNLNDKVKQVGPSLKFLDDDFNAVDYCTDKPYIEGWCFIIDRVIYDKRNILFDDKLAWAYCEDADLSTYIISLGYRIMKVDTSISHVGTQTAKSNKTLQQKCIAMEKLNKKYLRKKWNF